MKTIKNRQFLVSAGMIMMMIALSLLGVGCSTEEGTPDMDPWDLNDDGTKEFIKLAGGTLKVYQHHINTHSDQDLLWQTPAEWEVDHYFIGDANHDGRTELNMVVWKEGSYGPIKPFWVEEEDEAVRCHLFVFRLEDETMKPVWQSSNLPYPILAAELKDVTGDGKKELLVTHGCYDDPEVNEPSTWRWDEWGFRKIEEKAL